MTESQDKPDFSAVESRRSSRSQREMSTARKAYYFFGLPVLRAVFYLLSSTYRVQQVIGKDIEERIVSDSDAVYAPCYWHQHHVLCSGQIRNWITRGFRACFLISSSVDGEVPDRVARGWGAEVIRGSANQTGALVLRDMQQMMKRGVSIITTADGPNGPKYEFKAGTVLMARIGSAPMVPLACAAENAWYLDRWDDFMIPKPFSRVVMAIGEPVTVPTGAGKDDMENCRVEMQNAIMNLMSEATAALQRSKR